MYFFGMTQECYSAVWPWENHVIWLAAFLQLLELVTGLCWVPHHIPIRKKCHWHSLAFGIQQCLWQSKKPQLSLRVTAVEIAIKSLNTLQWFKFISMLVIADQRKSFPTKRNKLSEAKIKMLSCSDTVHNPKTFTQSQMLSSASSAGMSQLTLEQLLKICFLKTEPEQLELGSS